MKYLLLTTIKNLSYYLYVYIWQYLRLLMFSVYPSPGHTVKHRASNFDMTFLSDHQEILNFFFLQSSCSFLIFALRLVIFGKQDESEI